jgi:opacity protein-like surface antigen
MTTNRGSYLLGAVLGSALVLTSASNAIAADIYEPPLKGGYEVPPPPPSDRGIYIKGYVGAANPNVGSIWTSDYQSNTFDVFHHDIKSSPLFGIGVGWQARHWLRFDGTIEYRGDATFLGQDRYPGADGTYNIGTSAFNPGTNEYTADISSWLGLVNAYWDITHWCGFTPYVGAGIGFAAVSVNGLKDVNVPNNGVAFGSGNTNTNFAWAIHAGLSYDVTPQFVVDLAYRYADLGSASSGPVYTYQGNLAHDGLRIRDITSNDVMLGVRYKFDSAPVYAFK